MVDAAVSVVVVVVVEVTVVVVAVMLCVRVYTWWRWWGDATYANAQHLRPSVAGLSTRGEVGGVGIL